MRYSICMTNYNTEDVIKRSLDSIISKINLQDFEIVIVDNISADGSIDILKGYAKKYPNIKIISKKCLRGRGRQIAFEHAKGDLIITADCDTIYNDRWIELLKVYERNKCDFALSAWYTQIYPRELLEQVKGWNNLQYWEDVELWSRLAKLNKYKTCPVICGTNIKRNVSTNILESRYRRYRRVHDKVLLARHVPLYLYIITYLRIFSTNRNFVKGMRRSMEEIIILLFAKILGNIRRIVNDYGDIKYLTDYKKNLIQFDFKMEDMNIDTGKYDTKESCFRAYKKGDYGYLP